MNSNKQTTLLEQQLLKTQEELKLCQNELKKQDKYFDEFTYIVSHDLKQPFRNLSNYANFITEDYINSFDDEGRHYIESILRLSKQGSVLINALHEYSQLRRKELKFKSIDLKKELQSIINKFKTTYEKVTLTIDYNTSCKLFTCDIQLLTTVINEILSNAITFNTQDYQNILFTVTDRQKFILLKFQDNGIGIDRNNHHNIFNIFKKLNDQKSFHSGPGTGLAISKYIIEKHHGSIWVESSLGEGSAFYISLPLQ